MTLLLEAYLTAALITAGIIIGIGPQNIFVIKQGIRGRYVWAAVLVCIACEIITVSLGALGAGYLFSQTELLQQIIGIGGIAFLTYYGYQSFRSAFKKHDSIDITRAQISLKEIIMVTLSVSLLNPWALMDTMVIIGGGAAQYDTANMMVAFVFGSWTVSSIWFAAIGFGAKRFRTILNTEKANKAFDITAGCIMWLAALNLARTMVF